VEKTDESNGRGSGCTVIELADLLGVTKVSVYQWINAGKVQSYAGEGGLFSFTPEETDRIIQWRQDLENRKGPPEGFISSGKVAEILGITKSRLCVITAENRIPSVQGPLAGTGYKRWYKEEDVRNYRKRKDGK